MLTPRQEILLDYIIKDYTKTAKPISSGQMVGQNGIDLSPATIRNEMVALEEAGMLLQKHTSGGRIPTEAAWRWFVQRMQPEVSVGKRERDHLEAVAKQRHESEQELLRKMAKAIAEMIDEAVIVAFDRTDTYYTGLSNLFAQPEFADINVLQGLSKVVDHLDEVMATVFTRVGNDVHVMVGKENPFSATCGTVLGRYSIPRRSHGVIGFLGPLRQDYGEHMALMRYTQSLLQTV